MTTTSTKSNIIANLIGKTWTALIGFLFVPIYLRLIGVESYGLIGYYAAIQPVLSLLDMGLSLTLNRELARMSTKADSAHEMRTMLRTLEVIYWLACIAIGLIFVVAAPLIAAHGVHAQHLSIAQVTFAVGLMGLSLALQFPFSLYQGGLLGLQRQVILNYILIATSTLRAVGAALILWKVSPTAAAYFEWQAAVSVLQTAATAAVLWRAMPWAREAARFSKAAVASIWRFAAKISAIMVLSVVLTQLDKLVLSKMLTLEKFGYYTIATSAAACLLVITYPIYTAAFPRYTQMISRGDKERLITFYHQSCQTMSVLLGPVAIVVAMFSRELLWAWTGNSAVVENAHLPLTLLAIGNGVLGLVNQPYALQLASGWTKLTIHIFTCCIVLEVPALIFAISHYGSVGAASVWAILNICFVPVMVWLMHKRILIGELANWVRYDIGYPIMAAMIVGAIARIFAPHLLPSRALDLVIVALVGAACLAAAALAAPFTRSMIAGRVKKLMAMTA